MGRTNSTESASSLMSLSSADVSSNGSQQVVAMATPLPSFGQSTNSQQGAAVVVGLVVHNSIAIQLQTRENYALEEMDVQLVNTQHISLRFLVTFRR